MNRAILNYRMPPMSKEQRARLRQLEREFHVRAFGEELARVNLDMTKEERMKYLEWMRQTSRKHGVKPDKKFPYDGSLGEE
ncbi:MAG: hypothetical protein M3Y82_02355 [Verrucomicrobiota bacterium]|nr:hypothetical protein [Verrucomicrobiota bacterium]